MRTHSKAECKALNVVAQLANLPDNRHSKRLRIFHIRELHTSAGGRDQTRSMGPARGSAHKVQTIQWCHAVSKHLNASHWLLFPLFDAWFLSACRQELAAERDQRRC